MHRRDMLRLLSTTAIAPVLSPEIFTLLQQAQPPSNYTLRSLNPQQNEMVVVMTELIVPATDVPGAKAARVNEFIDVILTEWATAEQRGEFLTGLAGVDTLSNKLFGKKFVEASPEQQGALLRSMDDEVDWGLAPWRNRNNVPVSWRESHLRGEFFRSFKSITLSGYYTSEIGFTQDLKLEIIPGAQHGCVPVPDGKKA
jgi:gluconate 2-dehydrogenase gamma chain